MTREEAIDLLDNLVGMVEDNQENDYDTALKMAIEALKADGDTISRQAAINAIENTDCELSTDAWNELTDAIMSLPPTHAWNKFSPDDVSSGEV